MATKTTPKTTTTKPKATKKPAVAKTTVKTTKSAKTVKPVDAKPKTKVTISTLGDKKVAAPVKTKALVAVRESADDGLRKFLQAAFWIFSGFTIAAAFLMDKTTYPLTFGYQTKNDLASQVANQTVFAPAVRTFYDLPLKWAVVTTLGAAATLAALKLTLWRKRYADGVASRVQPARWLSLAVTSALMVEIVALLSGIRNIYTLKLMAGLMVTTCVLGWIAERQNKDESKPEWSAFLLSLFTGSLPWLVIFATAIATYLYGLIRAPWYVYALYVAVLGGFTLLALNQIRQYRRTGQLKSNYVVERNFIMIDILTKALFAAILIYGFRK